MESIAKSTISQSDKLDAEMRDHLNNWCKEHDTDATDKIIDAYEYGVKLGKQEIDKFKRKILSDNFLSAVKLSEDFYKWTKDQGIENVKAFLKIASIDIFETLITLDAEKYHNKEVRKSLYKKASDLRKENNTNTFNIEFILKPDSSELTASLLAKHGFILNYMPKD